MRSLTHTPTKREYSQICQIINLSDTESEPEDPKPKKIPKFNLIDKKDWDKKKEVEKEKKKTITPRRTTQVIPIPSYNPTNPEIPEADSFTCGFCYKIFQNKCSYKRHIKQHINPALFHCDLCTSTFRRKDSLPNHYRNKHPGEEMPDKFLKTDNTVPEEPHTSISIYRKKTKPNPVFTPKAKKITEKQPTNIESGKKSSSTQSINEMNQKDTPNHQD